MKFANLNQELLERQDLLTDDSEEPQSLKEQIQNLGIKEDIIHCEWKIEIYNKKPYLSKFLAWTNNYVLFLTYGTFNEKFISFVPRNPKMERKNEG